MSENPPAKEAEHPLGRLRCLTSARIALGRSGDSLPTSALLEFGIAHAMARDAVHTPLDVDAIEEQLNRAGLDSLRVHSAAEDRVSYLRRPDLGRALDESARNLLSALPDAGKLDVVFVIADGLSAVAPERYAVPVLQATLPLIGSWHIGPIIVADQARVALGDEIGELLGAEIVVMLIGERPGLSSPDSLGIYLTYAPKVGRADAERNCISNVRSEGMSVERAAQTLSYLLVQSRRLKLSGVALKDDSDTARAKLHDGANSSLRNKSKPRNQNKL